MAPVRNVPPATTTRPPPALLQASIALRIASVLSVLPSARAPNFVISKSRFGIVGALMRARIAGTCAQPVCAVCAEDALLPAPSAAKEQRAATSSQRRDRRNFSVIINPYFYHCHFV